MSTCLAVKPLLTPVHILSCFGAWFSVLQAAVQVKLKQFLKQEAAQQKQQAAAAAAAKSAPSPTPSASSSTTHASAAAAAPKPHPAPTIRTPSAQPASTGTQTSSGSSGSNAGKPPAAITAATAAKPAAVGSSGGTQSQQNGRLAAAAPAPADGRGSNVAAVRHSAAAAAAAAEDDNSSDYGSDDVHPAMSAAAAAAAAAASFGLYRPAKSLPGYQCKGSMGGGFSRMDSLNRKDQRQQGFWHEDYYAEGSEDGSEPEVTEDDLAMAAAAASRWASCWQLILPGCGLLGPMLLCVQLSKGSCLQDAENPVFLSYR